MTYYLLDNPPASRQFYTTRNASPTWAVGVHTSEGATGPGSAQSLAAFIARRSDPGSYAAIVDSEETVYLVPPDYTTFSVASSGYNSRTWHICLAGRSADLSPDDPNTQAMIVRAGAAIRELWQSLGIDVNAAAQWVGTDALNRVGLFCHGDVQPADRSDAWSRHPDRDALDQQLVNAIRIATPPPPPPSPIYITGDDEMIDRFLARAEGFPEVFLVAPGLGFRWHLPNEDRLRSAVFILNAFGGKILSPPPAAKVDIVAGQPVWVMNPADLAMIPVAA